jgi:hypothetical protein
MPSDVKNMKRENKKLENMKEKGGKTNDRGKLKVKMLNKCVRDKKRGKFWRISGMGKNIIF